MTGTLFILSAASGTGKTSLLKAVLNNFDHLKKSVSHTTRPMREGEVNGIDYHFTTHEQFQEMLSRAEFLEHAVVFGNMYGTSHQSIKEIIDNGDDVVLEIDWQGAQQVRTHIEKTVSIFILPPSFLALELRLTKRAQDNQNTIDKRLAKAADEISHYCEYDYLVINNEFDKALAELKSILISHRLRIQSQAVRHRRLLSDLLGG